MRDVMAVTKALADELAADARLVGVVSALAVLDHRPAAPDRRRHGQPASTPDACTHGPARSRRDRDAGSDSVSDSDVTGPIGVYKAGTAEDTFTSKC